MVALPPGVKPGYPHGVWSAQELVDLAYKVVQTYGVTGPTGPSGATGPTGHTGPTGPTGPTGA